jgi:hypothetical protein
MHYTDGSWNSIIISGAGSLLSIYFAPNTAKGWVVGDGGLISSSSDGMSFSSQTNPDTTGVTLNDVFSIDGENAWIVGYGGRILHTVNGGNNWTMEGEGLTTETLKAVFFTSNTNGYVVGDRTILKYTELAGVKDYKSTIDFRIYPNPAKDKIHLVCSELKKDSGIIEILNMEGKMVMKMEVRKGYEDLEIDLNDLQPGMYLCRITIDNRSSSEKIIIE